MCGIYLSLGKHAYIEPSQKTRELLRRRGPDSVQELKLEYDPGSSAHSRTYITCVGTVLSLRGDHTVSQPVRSGTDGPFLCWNGEAWKAAGAPLSGNDSEHIFQLLAAVCSPAVGDCELAIGAALATISGPHAFAFFDPLAKRLYYGRDVLGRRSLMFRFTEPGGFELTSISGSGADGWLEVEADGIYWIDLLKESDAAFHSKKMSYPSTIPSVFDDGRAFYPLELNNVTPIEGQEIPHLNALSPAVATLETLLRKSVSLRVSHIPTWWPLSESGPSTSPAKLAILFSGGLDCTVLARLAHDILDTSETIDLLNVAFENPRVHRQKTADPDFSPYESCPDRLTGRASFAELQLVCPGREWRFVAINIPYTETIAHRAEVMGLMHPHNTEMDLSIAYALYFAARGSGLLVRTAQEPTTPYTTTARVLLSGLGADELFGGYSRHGMAFNRRGYAGLIEELGLDIGRLGKRNLGRDDRVISNWGREARFPYLDEDFVHWALQAPVWEKCGFGEQPVEGKVDGGKQVDGSELLEPGKKVLRCLAWKLGMKSVASEKKRAIQFGARTAKMEVSRIKGTQLLT